MPVIRVSEQNPLVDGRQSENALSIQKGMISFLEEAGHVVIPEFPLANGRRADLLALDRKGLFTLIEIKSSVEDFRVDQKWPEYLGFCDRFSFATSTDVPENIFPVNEGLFYADAFGAHIIRNANEQKMAAATRKALTLRFGRLAAQRLARINKFAETNGYQLPLMPE